jgi:large repetitive protein
MKHQPEWSSYGRIRELQPLFVAALVIGAWLGLSFGLREQALAGPCDPPVLNPIVCENSKPGNPASEWDISGAGASSIQGFATDISVNQGETVHFKVDTDASAYRLDIYRLGYYGGMGARKIATVRPSVPLPQLQRDCLTDASTGLIDCGNWAESASWTVPADATSGIYIAKLVRESGASGASHIVFIVRDDDGGSDLLFQTSDTTWQAYNNYGGNSLYVGGPATNPGRAYEVSYNRPFNTRSNSTEDWLFNAEYPMVSWLEANGYNVSYFTGVDSDRRGQEILKHRVFLSVGHDEYWSGGQRANVEAARNAGVHLAFFSGNEVFWKTRWDTSIDGSGTPYRTLVCYKETHANAKVDPLPNVWTGTWRDPRFSPPADGGRPENALMGTIFTVNCCTYAITVPAADGKMRFWRNTSIATLASGQTATLSNGTLGYEWDEELDNGVRPAGLVRLSTTTVGGVQLLLDYGSTYGSGTATHRLTLYRHSSGALVFGAGTVQWSWGLDSNHDRGSTAPDVRMQQATVNLLADMGVQPGTLQSGLVAATASTDNAPPISTITSPAGGSTVQSGSPVTVVGTATDAGGGVVGGVEVSVDAGATWHPATGRGNWSYTWTPGAQGSVTIMSRAVDDSGNIEGSPASVTVTVSTGAPPPTCPCSLWSNATTPAVAADPDAQPIELGVKFRADVAGYITGLRFYKGPGNGGTHVGNLWASNGALLASATFTNETASGWQQVSLSAPVATSANTTYVASYHTTTGHYAVDDGYFAAAGFANAPLRALANGVEGGNGVYIYGASAFPTQSFNAGNYWVDVVFNTSAPSDTTPPTISSVSQPNGTTNVNPGANVTATFSEAMDPATINTNTFQLRAPAGNLVPTTVTYDAATRTATLDPTTPLAPATTYTVVIKGGVNGVKDAAGNPLSADLTWSFTTAASSSPDEGPGGPILVVAATSNPFSRYYAEILRTEGFNAFTISDISAVSSQTLAAYDVVILGAIPLTPAQVTMFSDWVNAGGKLIAMRPDKQLAGLLGLTDASSILANAYLLVNTSTGPGVGIVSQTIQFSGIADRYTLSGASSLATLYSNATAATANPAVTLRSVGTNGGQAAAFTYDLALSVVDMRQGNTAWAGQERDGFQPIRSDDMYFGNASGDPQPDWVNLNKVGIPQADEQQRLLANLILHMNRDKKPLPRFWYFPHGKKAVVIMTGDDHANGGTAGRFDQYKANSPSGCSVADWECIRSTSYIYPTAPLTNAQAAAYVADGFEVALHITTGCDNWTPSSLESFYSDQLSTFATNYPSVPMPTTHRLHCLVWSDYITQTQVELAHGIRLDTTYYYWPPSWLQDRPGFFTGSGMPMRFAALDGTMIDVYQATTQMTDESGQTYPFTINALLDKAIGAEGYYGAFTANMHTDSATSSGSDAIIASAQARGIPVVSARQMLTWLDGRNASSFGSVAWNGNTLSFTITPGSGTNGIQAMLPTTVAAGTLTGITRNGSSVSYTTQVVKGIDYALFAAAAGAYQATYAPDTSPPTVSSTSVPNGATGVDPGTSITITFSEAMNAATITTSTIELRDASGNLVAASVTYDPATHIATLDPTASLAAATTYTITIKGGANGVKDAAGNPLAADVTSSFTTAAPPTCPCSLWSNATTPAVTSASDAQAVELGVKFRATVNGSITGLRFYKGSGNTGTHVGNLWTSSGTLLASATYTNETASGWQQVSLSAPVAISANTTYVASYHTTTGHYALDAAYFASAGVNNPPLRALANGEDGGNGVYIYGTGGFPTQTFNASNYWVDVVFNTSAPPSDTTPPTITGVSPTSGATGVSTGANVTATFSEAMDAATITTNTVQLRDPASNLVPATVTYDAPSKTVTLDPTASLAPLTTYAVTIKGGANGVKDLAGNPLSADTTWSFTTAALTCPCTLWSDATSPAVAADSDAQGIELGVKFRADVAGYITGLRFYKGPGNGGTHVGNLWASNGTLLASATFTNETASGWQQVSLSAPVATSANTTYVASYHTATGHYAVNNGYFATAFTNAPLRALANGVEGGNGVYIYGASAFPTQSFNASNYWVDVVFNTSLPPGTFLDTTVVDFTAGTPDASTYIGQTADGEVLLAPMVGAEFAGTALPAGWTATPWGTGGTSTVANGVLTVNGARAGTVALFGPSRALEFVATFSGAANQNVGFGVDFSNPPWVMFSTRNGASLSVQTRLGSVTTNTSLGSSWLGVPHRYRIDWNATNVVYSIDGQVVATHTVAITTNMRPLASDRTVGGDNVLVDWMRMTPYAASGTFTSRVFDAGGSVPWGTATWTSQVPSGTTLVISVRQGNTPTPDGTWTVFTPLAGSGTTIGGSYRYLQYRAQLSTTTPNQTPVLQDITIRYSPGGL